MTTTIDWSAVAPSWDAHRSDVVESNAPVAEHLLQALELQPGDRVLEVAAGTGELSLQMADRVVPGGSVLSSDAAAGMVDLIHQTVLRRPEASVAVRQLDADDTGLPDASVDAVVCQMGLMFLTEPASAVREWHRVLAPGGRLALAVWAGPQQNAWLANVGMSAMLHGVFAGGPPMAPGGVFSMSDPEALRSLVTGAGFTDVVIDEVPAPACYASSDEHFDLVTALAGPLAVAISAAGEAERATVRAAVADADAPFASDDGLVLPGLALVVRARRRG